MSEMSNINGVRGTVLDRIQRSESHYKRAFFAGAIVEASFLVGFMLLADLSDRTHVLLLIAAVAIYTILALGLVALGAYINRSTLRILKAVELLGSQVADGKG
jgi:predicted neutral ceramidase superfamily lipid hydrolase